MFFCCYFGLTNCSITSILYRGVRACNSLYTLNLGKPLEESWVNVRDDKVVLIGQTSLSGFQCLNLGVEGWAVAAELSERQPRHGSVFMSQTKNPGDQSPGPESAHHRRTQVLFLFCFLLFSVSSFFSLLCFAAASDCLWAQHCRLIPPESPDRRRHWLD